MNRKQLEKNRLDLSYKRNLQLLNATLIIGGGSFVASLVGIVLNLEKIKEYTIILVIIGITTYIFYLNINNNLQQISKEIKKLYK